MNFRFVLEKMIYRETQLIIKHFRSLEQINGVGRPSSLAGECIALVGM